MRRKEERAGAQEAQCPAHCEHPASTCFYSVRQARAHAVMGECLSSALPTHHVLGGDNSDGKETLLGEEHIHSTQNPGPAFKSGSHRLMCFESLGEVYNLQFTGQRMPTVYTLSDTQQAMNVPVLTLSVCPKELKSKALK